MRKTTATFILCLVACLPALIWQHPASALWRSNATVSAAPDPAHCFSAPALTRGFETSSGLPNGDLFLLPQRVSFALTPAVDGASILLVNSTNFGAHTVGGNAGLLKGTASQIFAFSTPNETATALSCADSFWEINFEIAGAGTTAGDTIRLFLKKEDGAETQELVTFKVAEAGLRKSKAVMPTQLHEHAALFYNNRAAADAGQLSLNDCLPYGLPAGSSGSRTGLFTLALSMAGDAPFHGCFQLGVEIKRAGGSGVTTISITDLVVNRETKPGDEDKSGVGLLEELPGGFPSGLPCNSSCESCPAPPPAPTDSPDSTPTHTPTPTPTPICSPTPTPTCSPTPTPTPICTPTPTPTPPGGTPCPQGSFTVPAVTHGFDKTDELPEGDLFLLPQGLTMTLSALTGVNIFPVNDSNFGKHPGFLNTNLQGISFSTPNSSVKVISCTDSFRNINFVIASTGATEGDRVRLFVQNPNGSGVKNLATFTVHDDGVIVSQLNSSVGLFLSNRLADGDSLSLNTFIPFHTPAGTNGHRTDLLTMAILTEHDWTLAECFQLGAEIKRDGGKGATALVFTDVVVNREAQPGDEHHPGLGLLGGLCNGFPTKLKCKVVCPSCPQTPSTGPCPQGSFTAPAVTFGFDKTKDLPKGDQFLLPQPLALTLSSLDTGSIFQVNNTSFGGPVGLPATTLSGFAVTHPNTSVKAVSCTDSFWDVNFHIASHGSTEGDTVRLFVQNPNGDGVQNLATFTRHDDGLLLTERHANVSVFVNNRLAMGSGLSVGAFIPMTTPAGSSGFRTELLTISFSMNPHSPLAGCFQLGAEIKRASGNGTTAVVFTDLVVKRNELPGDRLRSATGLFGGLCGGFPTGLKCEVICPPCPPPVSGGGGPGKCVSICFRSPEYYLLNLKRLPRGSVLIGGVNFNSPVSTTNVQAIRLALLGGATPLQRVNQEYVALQLSLAAAGGIGSPLYFNALWSNLGCLGPHFHPVKLSNGVTLTPDSMLKELTMQVESAIKESRTADLVALSGLLDLLNGNDPFGCR